MLDGDADGAPIIPTEEAKIEIEANQTVSEESKASETNILPVAKPIIVEPVAE